MGSSGSEGEIMEDVKATRAPTNNKHPQIDRHSRLSTPSTTSRHSQEPVYPRSRSRSRSPYRAPRGEKRRLVDDHYDHDRRDGRQHRPRYEADDRRRPVSYADIDKNEVQSFDKSRARDSAHYGRNESKYTGRYRSRSRSPYRRPKDAPKLVSIGKPTENRKSFEHNRANHTSESEHPDRDRAEKRDDKSNGTIHDRSVNGQTKLGANKTRQNISSSGNGNTTNGNQSPIAENEPEPIDEEARIEARRKQREAIKAKYKNNASAPLLVQALHIGNESGSATPKVQTPRVDIASANDARIESPGDVVSPSTPAQASMPGSPLVNNELTNNLQIDASPAVADEPSAADYDPMMDMHEDRARKEGDRARQADASAADYDETEASERHDIHIPDTTENNGSKEADMFADDDDDFDMFSDGPMKPTNTTTKAVQVPKGKVLAAGLLDNWDDPEGYYKIIQGELLNNRYLVKEQLGKGVFANVVRAMDNETNTLVAIKVVRNNDIMRKAGLKEIDYLEKLNEADPTDVRHVVQLLRHFMHKNHLCMVFENLDLNLRSVIKTFGRSVGLPLNVVRSYAIQMFKALTLLKKCNILHADIKPDNILADKAGNKVKVADLGSASDIQEGGITPYLVSRFYRAPEIMLGILPDYAIDMWSVACTLFELFTDQILFKGNSNNHMLKVIMECRGRITKKVLRRGAAEYKGMYFDMHLDTFYSIEKDAVTGRVNVREIVMSSSPVVGKDIKSRITAAARKHKITGPTVLKEVDQLRDLLEKCLKLDPEERLTPVQALQHPFIQQGKKMGK